MSRRQYEAATQPWQAVTLRSSRAVNRRMSLRCASTLAALAAALAVSPACALADVVPGVSDETPATAFGPLVAGQTYTAALQTLNDTDYLYIYPSVANQQVTVTLANTSPPTFYANGETAQLEDSTGNILGYDAGAGVTPGGVGPGAMDQGSWTLGPQARYLVAVEFTPGYVQDAPADYRLTISSPNPFLSAPASAPSTPAACASATAKLAADRRTLARQRLKLARTHSASSKRRDRRAVASTRALVAKDAAAMRTACG